MTPAFRIPVAGVAVGPEADAIIQYAEKSSTALRPYNSAERKAMPMHVILAEYFPDAIGAVARHAFKANDKHNPGERMYWARNKSTDHLNCAVRHLATPDAIDPDTGEIELVGAAWRCLAALQLREEKRLVAAGIIPLSGVTNVEASQDKAAPVLKVRPNPGTPE